MTVTFKESQNLKVQISYGVSNGDFEESDQTMYQDVIAWYMNMQM